jgi:hypothetical protein
MSEKNMTVAIRAAGITGEDGWGTYTVPTTPPILDELTPYAEDKTIFILATNFRGSAKIVDPAVELVCLGYYDIGDAGTASAIYAGHFTFPDLVAFINKWYSVVQRARADDKYQLTDSYIDFEEVFEVDGWRYEADEPWSTQELIMDESGEAIRAYLAGQHQTRSYDEIVAERKAIPNIYF